MNRYKNFHGEFRELYWALFDDLEEDLFENLYKFLMKDLEEKLYAKFEILLQQRLNETARNDIGVQAERTDSGAVSKDVSGTATAADKN